IIVNPIVGIGKTFKKYVEKSGIAKITTVIGATSLIFSDRTKSIQTGNIASYILLMVVGIIIGLGIFFLGIF
ncbi:MAG: NADH-quinone oxidoreductase subunit L, partial [Weeksellaceae bacterium]|nr:NADH-quinone oxidoreductase subunit L [Weeksellaceae bacterium]